MVKFDGMSVLKMEWLVSTLKKDTKCEDKVVKRAFVEVMFEKLNYPELLDEVAEYITENYETRSDE